jgi:hypothetical protein
VRHGLREKGNSGPARGRQTEKYYVLLPPKDAQSLPADVVNKMEDEVTVTGTEYSKGGMTFLTVNSVK